MAQNKRLQSNFATLLDKFDLLQRPFCVGSLTQHKHSLVQLEGALCEVWNGPLCPLYHPFSLMDVMGEGDFGRSYAPPHTPSHCWPAIFIFSN